MSDVYGLLGERLGHSHSPEIHKLILESMGLKGCYNLFEVKKEDIRAAVKGLQVLGAKGINVTIPYKVQVMKELDEVSKEAENIGAVNTISLEGGVLKGYNTDYYGFGETLKKFNIPVKGKRAVILGTGGVSKAVRQYLLDNEIESITYVSRHKENKIGNFKVIDYSEVKYLSNEDMLINCTPCGMYPNVEISPIAKEVVNEFSYVIDLIYNPEETTLLKYAKELNLLGVNGLYMLVAQAVKAQEIWQSTKLHSDIVDEIYEALRKKLY